MTVIVRDVEAAILRRFPPERAEGWDRSGLLAGDPGREVTGVVLALDPTREAISAAVDARANVLVTHHPAFLEPPKAAVPGLGAGGVLFHALDSGVALINAHTNLDRDPEAQRFIPDALALTPIGPLEAAPMPMSVVTVYCPEGAADAVKSAMVGAGAGRIGDYEGCSFSGEGVGEFTPSTGSSPFVGSPGEPTRAGEQRIEMVCPRRLAAGVIAAACAAHPYEEPLVSAADVMLARNGAALGMLCGVLGSITLGELARRAASAYGVTPRVWGDPSSPIDVVATATGSGGSLVPAAVSSPARALVAGEVRYHDALEALEAGVCIIELGHDVTEWPLVSLLRDTVLSVPGLAAERVRLLPSTPRWWTTGS